MDVRPYLQFNRRLSGGVTLFFSKTHLSPNHVTAFALLAGVAAGFCMSAGTRPALLWGALCLHLSFIFDNSDGELARLKRARTKLGGWFDMISDVLTDLSLWVGLYAGAVLTARPETFFPHAWVGAAACAGSIVNFLIVVRERQTGCSTSVHVEKPGDPAREKSVFHQLLDTVAHNGDSIALAWIMALIGDPAFFLLCGAFFINSLWITRLAVNAKKLLGRHWRAIPKVLAAGLGVWLLTVLFREVSWNGLGELLARGGAGLAVVFLVYPVMCAFYALGFLHLFPRATRRRMSFRTLYSVNLTGDALNRVTPFLDVGGEPVKIALAYKRGLASLDEAIVATYVSRVVFVVTEIVFILLGIAALWIASPSREFAWIGAGGVLFSLVVLFALLRAQKKGVAGSFAKVTTLLRDQAPPETNGEVWKKADATLKHFYRDRKRDFMASVFWNELGWFVLLLEVYVTFRALGLDISLGQAFIIQSILQAIKTVSFFIPGNIGAQEGGLAYLVAHLGFSMTHGVALSVVKRARQVVWVLAAPLFYALVFGAWRRRPAPQKAA